jgi:hypothetical protein
VQKWESYGPREFLTSNGLGSMGYAVPGALAARMAYPDRPVVAFTGDGGFLMTVAELQTAQREDLPIIVLVFDDREIGLIRVKQEIKGIAAHGVQLGGIDWEKLAQSFGADGVTVETEQALANALQAALQSQRTTVIGVRIDASGYVAQFNALRLGALRGTTGSLRCFVKPRSARSPIPGRSSPPTASSRRSEAARLRHSARQFLVTHNGCFPELEQTSERLHGRATPACPPHPHGVSDPVRPAPGWVRRRGAPRCPRFHEPTGPPSEFPMRPGGPNWCSASSAW